MVEPLRVRVLGGLVVEGVEERALGSHKARRLLKVLVLARGAAVPVDRLVDVLWGEAPPARPTDQVGVLVSRLRGVLGADRLRRTDAGYLLVVDWLDVDELTARVGEAGDALSRGRFGAAGAAAEAAIALARGPVLPEEEGGWVEVERAAAHACSASARRVAAEAADRAGHHLSAAALAEQALAYDPYDEACLRVLMRADTAAGRPASALAAYGRMRERLAQDLGVPPMTETVALNAAIVVGQLPPATTRTSSHIRTVHGRDIELAALDAALDQALATAAGCTVVVQGEAGMGKSALVQEWTSRAATRALVLLGRCDPLGRDLPLQPVVDALTVALAGRSPAERRSVLGDDAPVVGPFLGVGSFADVGGATVLDDPDIGRARLFGALLGVVHRLAEGRPVVIAVDDLHLASASTSAWLSFAARRLPRLVVVVSTRPGSDLQLGANRVLTLGPLDLAAAVAVVGQARAGELHARSGGHPLLLTALAHSSGENLPTSVRDAVDHRVADLGATALTLRAAAVLGDDIDLDVLAAVLQSSAARLLDHLEAAAARGLLVYRGVGLTFRHELEREALEASVGSARRALLHRDAARALASRPAPDPLAVAVHARLGGEIDLAATWYLRAADASVARYDLTSARAHVDSALALTESAGAYAARARLAMAGGQLDEAATDAARAVAAGGGARALEVAGWVAYYRRRYDLARVQADEGVATAVEPAVRVSCLALAGRVRHGSGDVREAVDRLESAVAESAPPEVRGLAAVWLAQARIHEGRPADALDLLEPVLLAPERLAHPFAPLHGRFVRVLALGQLGRVSEALRALDDLDAVVARAGDVGARMRGPALNARAWVLRWTGLPGPADDLNTEAVSRAEPSGPLSEPHYAGLLDLTDGRLLAGDIEGAAALLGRMEGIGSWQGTMAWHQRHRWGLARARLALAGGDRETAALLSAEVETDATSRGTRRYALLATAVGALAGGEPAGDMGRLDGIVGELGRCAALDGWPLVAGLAAEFGSATWRAEAERRAVAVAAAAPDGDAVRAFASRVLG